MIKELKTIPIDIVRTEIIQLNLVIKDLIQRIRNCKGPIEKLNELNYEVRKKITLLRQNLTMLETLAKEEVKPSTRKSLVDEVDRSELELTVTIAAYHKAHATSLNWINSLNRKELLDGADESMLRHRKERDKENLLKMTSNMTDQLLSISRLLADTTQRNSETLSTLITSSSTVDSTREELENTGSVIAQSGKLIAKYGRREKTDKVLVFFAFVFFLACVFYIIQKRLF